MIIINGIIPQLLLGLAALLTLLPLIFAIWICEKGRKKERENCKRAPEDPPA
ncbi:MAG: hypothetical protein FWD99_07430 [Oscillospiraceae bacterium]|nr:hypothetical protein [Oscillospiraceae bacterium]